MADPTPALRAFLLSKRPCFIADLYTFRLINGTTYYWTTSDQPIIANTITYLNVGPAITRSRWAIKNTTEVPSMDLVLLSNGNDFSGQNIKLAIHNGLLDGASVSLNRAYMPIFGDTSLGTPLMFGGRVSSVKISAKGAEISVKGHNLLMQQYAPANVYSYSCIHSLYGKGCNLNASDFTFSNSIGSPSNSIKIAWGSGTPPNVDAFSLGYVTMTGGVALGQTRTILKSDTTGITLAYPLYQSPSPGDAFTVTRGCDKKKSTCEDVFENVQNFRGFPFIPPAETGL